MESKLRQDDDALWRRFAESRDPAIREELVRRNMPFAKRLALRYRGASESFDDLLQVANLGLLGAIDRFDPERGTRTVQTRSRKWRLSSPRMVGEANAVKGMPRSGSKRSIAPSRPRLATWSRSSKDSLAPR